MFCSSSQTKVLLDIPTLTKGATPAQLLGAPCGCKDYFTPGCWNPWIILTIDSNVNVAEKLTALAVVDDFVMVGIERVVLGPWELSLWNTREAASLTQIQVDIYPSPVGQEP